LEKQLGAMFDVLCVDLKRDLSKGEGSNGHMVHS
jgi:hypothetical protein